MRKLGMVIALSLIGCDAADTGWTIVEQQTASGVRHVVNEPPATGIEPTWTIVPELRIGAVEEDGPENFGTIKGITVDEQGRIAVLDAQAQELRIFGVDGKHQRTFGGKGGGPGELDDANGLLLGKDGLLRVNDPSNARLSFFHPDTGFAGSIPLNVSAFGWIWTAVLDSAGWLAADARVYLEQPAARGEPVLPPGLRPLRSKRAGEVGYHLAGRVGD